MIFIIKPWSDYNTKMSLESKLANIARLPPGEHIIYINSKTPITYPQVRALVPPHLDFTLCKRDLGEDLSEFKCLHFTVIILTAGIALFAYLGFWIYEKFRPLYVVTISIPLTGFDWENQIKNPMLDV